MTGSPSTFIKEEPEGFDFSSNNKFNNNFGYQFNQTSGDMGGVNPSDVMSGNMMSNNFGMSSNFVGDDELLDLVGENDNNNFNNFNFNPNQNQQSFPMNQQMFSHTPDTNPIASPFNQGYDFSNQYNMNRTGFSQSIPTTMGMHSGAYPRNLKAERQSSDSRSPMTPRTPNINGLHLGQSFNGTPESLQHQALMNQQLHNQARMSSQNWMGSHSAHSWDDDSLASPHSLHHMQHAQISDMMASGKHASMPAKMENGGMPGLQSQEAKKKRRRESHNAVERRRRDNINERIADLSKLVPQHRLEDEKVKKHISNNGPLSPTFGPSGMSPPNATSLLAGGTGKRAAGNITQGLPPEDKDKGPNKGDILNGSVSWMRDLMWYLSLKLRQEQELKQYIESMGGQWPLDQPSVDERYMRTEILDAVERNGEHSFHYTRAPGTGLRVPKHTNIAGEPLSPNHREASPSNGLLNGSHQHFWSNSANRTPFSLKEEEEEEFDMEVN